MVLREIAIDEYCILEGKQNLEGEKKKKKYEGLKKVSLSIRYFRQLRTLIYYRSWLENNSIGKLPQ